jgi:hypothetical protein
MPPCTGFAQAGDTFIGMNLNKQVSVDKEWFDFCDFHGLPSFFDYSREHLRIAACDRNIDFRFCGDAWSSR